MPKVPKGWGFDMSRWENKVNASRSALKKNIIPMMVEKGIDMMNEEVTKNLSGVMHPAGTPSPTPGQLPVTGITANLRGAVMSVRLSNTLGIVFVDKRKAPYGKVVHEGAKRKDGKGYFMRPRRFFRQARLTVGPKLLAFWRAQLKMIGKP